MTTRNKNIEWLGGEVNRWVRDGIINESSAEGIRRLYPVERGVRPWALIVFSGIGAVIIGLGVILLFAYNWQYMSKAAKLGVIFSAIMISHAAGIWLFLRSERFRNLGEAFIVLGTMLFGAGIWLVAQIYHIQEHFPTAFFLWGLGALAFAWFMPSVAQAIMAAVLFTIWAGAEAMGFDTATNWAVLIILSLLLLAYQERSRVLLEIVILASGFTVSFVSSACVEAHIVFNILLSVAVTYISLGYLSERYGKFPESAPIFHNLGLAAYFVMLFILTFPDIAAEKVSYEIPVKSWYVLYWLVPLIAAVTGWAAAGWLASPWSRRIQVKDFPIDFLLIPLLLVFRYFQAFFLRGLEGWSSAAAFNLIFLAHAAGFMARGCRDGRLDYAIIGSLLLLALTCARYVDLFESLAARGLVFIIVGGLLFVQGIFYVRRRKQVKEQVL